MQTKLLLGPLAFAIALASVVGLMSLDAVFAQTPTDAPAVSTPINDVVPPVVSTILPNVEEVRPESSQAEASTGRVEGDPIEAGGSGSPFTGVRGGFIGAGIGLGAVALIAAVAVGARAIAGRAGN